MSYLWILLAVALLISSVGWRFFIYFFSIGYGYSIAGLAVTIALLFHTQLTLPTLICCVIMFVFGCRLGTFLLVREKRAKNYTAINGLHNPKAIGMFFIWVSCALLYVGQVAPLAFRLGNTSQEVAVQPMWAWIGAIFMFSGLLLETIADMQKSKSKKINPRRFIDTGLYRYVRCPNYFGEIMMWTGALLLNFGIGASFWQWVIALIGYAGIIYVMFSGARRLEIRQDESYGNNPEYRAYISRTPILIPFLPIYSVKKHEWLKA